MPFSSRRPIATVYFNPRLREGGDLQIPGAHIAFIYFNPRLREGGDNRLSLFDGGDMISIHASAKEATRQPYKVWSVYRFQSTPPRRRRHANNTRDIIDNQFQSTPPRRRRLLLFLPSAPSPDFNPRLREGGDLLPAVYLYRETAYFNPRLREGGDSFHSLANQSTMRFQSTPPRRRRQRFLMLKQLSGYFNPRLREGGDTKMVRVTLRQIRFQSTPPRRRRR